MTASPGREVDANLLPGAALGSAEARANTQDAGGQDFGGFVEAFGWSHEGGRKASGGADVACSHVRGISVAGSSCFFITLPRSILYRQAPIHAVTRPPVQGR
jgi:hypothetical protein